MTGATVSSVQVMVRETERAVLPHASVAVHERVWVREQPLAETVPVDATGVTGPQASVAVAWPNAESIAEAEGLQPRVNVVPVAVMTGATVSSVQVMVRETERAVLPHASVAVHERVWVREQPLAETVPVDATGVTGPQA